MNTRFTKDEKETYDKRYKIGQVGIYYIAKIDDDQFGEYILFKQKYTLLMIVAKLKEQPLDVRRIFGTNDKEKMDEYVLYHCDELIKASDDITNTTEQ